MDGALSLAIPGQGYERACWNHWEEGVKGEERMDERWKGQGDGENEAVSWAGAKQQSAEAHREANNWGIVWWLEILL